MKIKASGTLGRRGTMCLLASAASAGIVTLTASSPSRGQVFRAAVDLIAVDVQVVDRDGHPEDADRDGRPRELKVKVAQRGVTVRSRQWVVIPAPRGNS